MDASEIRLACLRMAVDFAGPRAVPFENVLANATIMEQYVCGVKRDNPKATPNDNADSSPAAGGQAKNPSRNRK